MKKAVIVGRTLVDDTSGGAKGTLGDVLIVKNIYGKKTVAVLPIEACDRLEREFDISTIPINPRSTFQKFFGLLSLKSMDRLNPYIEKNMETLFSEADIVFFTGSVLGRYSSRIRKLYNIPTVVFHRNFEKRYYRDTASRFPLKQIYMFLSNRQQRMSWLDSDISLARTAFDLNEISSHYGNTSKFTALFGYHESISVNNAPKETRCTNKTIKLAITGNLSVYKAYVGITWFLEHVVPKLLTKNISFELIVAGKNPAESIAKYHGKNNIKVIPNPKDINAIINDCDIYVNPCSEGSGIKVRNSDGPRNGLPIICHADNAHGYEHLPRELMKQFKTADEFAIMLAETVDWIDNTENPKGLVYQLYHDHFSIEKGAMELKQIMRDAGLGSCLPNDT